MFCEYFAYYQVLQDLDPLKLSDKFWNFDMTVMITDTNKDFNKWIKIALRDLEKEHWCEAQEKITILKEENQTVLNF